MNPNLKMAGGSVGLALAVILSWLVGLTGIDMPPEVQVAIGSIITYVFAHLPEQWATQIGDQK